MEIALCYIVEDALDDAFTRDVYTLNMYDLLKSQKVTKAELLELQESSTISEISSIIEELELYLEGGDDSEHKQIREGYGHLGKPKARKIKNYLCGIIDDVLQYEQDKKPGRKKGSKNRPKLSK
tara:strand:+ start:3727 stop:4098 length:372 start_codon:yes stop_codon:yes gene_type:complete